METTTLHKWLVGSLLGSVIIWIGLFIAGIWTGDARFGITGLVFIGLTVVLAIGCVATMYDGVQFEPDDPSDWDF